MAGRSSSHVLSAHRTRGLQHHPPCDPPRGPAAAGHRTTWHLAVCGWRRQSQARASRRKGATPFPSHGKVTKTPVTPTNRQELTSVGNKKKGYERREQKTVLKCDTSQKKQKKMRALPRRARLLQSEVSRPQSFGHVFQVLI